MRCTKCKMAVKTVKLRSGKYAVVDFAPRVTIATEDGYVAQGWRLHSETCPFADKEGMQSGETERCS